MKVVSWATLPLLLLTLPAEAQDDGGLPAFEPGAYARTVLGESSTESEPEPEFRQTRRGRRPVRRATSGEPGQGGLPPRSRRGTARGARGALLGEERGKAAEFPQSQANIDDPDYDGLNASDRVAGYKEILGRPFIQGRGDEQAASVDDVKQGSLGDCYFLASLAAVVNSNPGLIEGMVTDNGDGTYTVRLFELPFESVLQFPVAFGLDVMGTSRFRDVIVDADFPVSETGYPLFATPGDTDYKSKERELWVMLAEKAYAQLKGDYESIGEGGFPDLALNSITGNGSERFTFGLGDDEELDARLRSALAEGRPIVMGSKKHIFDDDALPGGVVQGHAYAVIGVDGDRYELYNPWGYKHPEPMTAAELKEAFKALSIGR